MYKNRLVLVTGSTSGIGKSTTILLHKEGYQLLLLGRDKKKLSIFRQELIAKSNTDVYTYDLDLTSNNEIKCLFSNADIPWQNLYGLVNCAGSSMGNDILSISDDEWNYSLQVNLTAPFLLTKLFLQKKIESLNIHSSGSIVNVASILGLTGGRKPNYGAAKAGLIALTKSTAYSVGKYSIRANAICPGAVNTEMTAGWDEQKRKIIISNTPLGRIGKPEEIANSISFLLSDKASFVSGAILNVSGGQYLGN